ncbi:MAG: dephospho-CoA kinase [Anaerolinea sp.]|nr:dephospho-CoA kinase [Anaerolinea sp.]
MLLPNPEFRLHVIGLTGGIASGKSTVARFFRDHEVPVLDADILGHRTYDPGTDTFAAVVKAFGDDLVAPDGSIDRRVLGGKVFGKPDELKRLTDIVWPGIRKLASEALSELETGGTRLAVLEAAVLFEAGWEDLTDEIWVVVVEPDQAVERLAARNGLDPDAARARIASQLSNAERTARADVIIENNADMATLEQRIQDAWDQLQERLRTAAGR